MVKFEGKRVFCLVTGASQGIGRCISVEAAKKFGSNSKLVLIARSEEGLDETRKMVLENRKDITVQKYTFDLSKPNAEKFNKMLEENNKEKFDICVLVHNAGSEGNSCLAKNMDDLEEWQRYMALNLYSVTMLTSSFLKLFSSVESKVIVNITSLGAIQPFKTMSYYCVGKAAREMYFRTLVEENPELNVLSYSPGPVETEMVARIIKFTSDDDLKKNFVTMRDEKKLVQPHDTVHKLLRCLEEEKYKSGGRIDYFDG